jgi:hypothetical protein
MAKRKDPMLKYMAIDEQLTREILECGSHGCDCHFGVGNTHCPNGEGHTNGDRDPSLSVATRNGRLLTHCFGGCDPGVVWDALLARAEQHWRVVINGGMP